MLDRFRIRSNADQMSQLMRQLPDRFVRPAANQAINRTLTNTRAEFTRRVRARLAVKARAVRDSMSTQRSNRRTLSATMSWDFQPISLKEFGNVRQGRKGVAVTQLRGRRQTLRGAFISEALGGHVFRREGEKRPMQRGRYANRRRRDGSLIRRQPIKKLFGPSMIKQAEIIMPGMRDWIDERMRENTRQAANRFIALATREGRR